MKKPALVIILVLLIDQISKFWIKTNMYLGQEHHIIGDWFIIHFTENNGMAFGMEFGGELGKIALTIFRILAVSGISYYLWFLIKNKAHHLLILSISLIFAGALGNIIDSTFYGIWFSSSTYEIAQFLPEGGGYSSILQGKVVDILYFPIYKGYLPEFLGGRYFEFFGPVFNIADTAISTGVGLLIIVQLFVKHDHVENDVKSPTAEEASESSDATEDKIME
ncbi:MAG: lipoprotein signal peptidase [Bacteroidia bacterium]|nr:lipoprotein signal peptidase [Bacteroidia bacterium]